MSKRKKKITAPPTLLERANAIYDNWCEGHGSDEECLEDLMELIRTDQRRTNKKGKTT